MKVNIHNNEGYKILEFYFFSKGSRINKIFSVWYYLYGSSTRNMFISSNIFPEIQI